MSNRGSMSFEDRLAREITGEVFFDRFNRGRYATDASFYQIMPAGVVVPRTIDEALRALSIVRDDGRIVTPRGGGTSQCGQTVNRRHRHRFLQAPESHHLARRRKSKLRGRAGNRAG